MNNTLDVSQEDFDLLCRAVTQILDRLRRNPDAAYVERVLAGMRSAPLHEGEAFCRGILDKIRQGGDRAWEELGDKLLEVALENREQLLERKSGELVA